MPRRTTLVSCRARLLLSTLSVPLLFGSAETAHEEDAARSFLVTSFHLMEADLARIAQGQVVARTMAARDKREVVTFGVVRVGITPEFYVERLTDIADFKRDEEVLQVGAFGNPPQLQDVAGLTLDAADIRSLRVCRVGDCGVQLSAAAISRFRQEVDWRGADASEQANGLMRRILVEYVTDYVNTGRAAAMQYADQRELVDLGHEFNSLVESGVGGWTRFPALRRHLVEYPATGAPGTIDVVYWSKEKVGRRTVASVTHLAISRSNGESPADYAVGSKHIYGSHYFDASLGLTVLLRDHSGPSPATYVAYVNHSRVDVFGGLFGGVTRAMVSSRARATVSDQLARLKGRLERQFAVRRTD
jgi:hypothetical protein